MGLRIRNPFADPIAGSRDHPRPPATTPDLHPTSLQKPSVLHGSVELFQTKTRILLGSGDHDLHPSQLKCNVFFKKLGPPSQNANSLDSLPKTKRFAW